VIRRVPPRRTLALIVCAAVALGVAGCSTADAAGTRLYTYPGNPLFAAAALLKDNGHQQEAAALSTVAKAPAGIWAAGQPGEMQQVKQVTAAATKAGAIPVIVAYNLPGRDSCGKFSSTGGITASGYEGYIRELAAAVGSGEDIVIVEPDGLPDIVRGCLSRARAAERYRLLHYAMKQLSALPHARVYLDAGNPGEFASPGPLARPLKRAGVALGRGFSANVSNFEWTSTVVAWSRRLEHDLHDKARAVIDTSRNGRGPYTGPDKPQWCNPPGRALGRTPTLSPGVAGVDAFLWVKDPGASDGPCNGGPAAGQYWPRYALALEAASHNQQG
jgi:endoglucanase